MSDNIGRPELIWVYFFSLEDGLVCKQLSSGRNFFGTKVTYDEDRKLTLPTREFSVSYDMCWSSEKDIEKALLAFRESHQRIWKDLTRRANHEVSKIRKINNELRVLIGLEGSDLWQT